MSEQQRILMAQANCGNYFPEWIKQPPAQWVMDLPWQEICVDYYSTLLIIAELDLFYRCFASTPSATGLPAELHSALVIYQGVVAEQEAVASAGCVALIEAFAEQNKPRVYLSTKALAEQHALALGCSHLLQGAEIKRLTC